MGNAISAMTGLGTNELAADQRCRSISVHLAKEAAQVGLALGLDVVDVNSKPAQMWADADKGDVFEELDDYFAGRKTRVNWLASMAQDVHKGRRSEVDFMNGLVSRKGLEVGVRTPYNDSMVSAMHRIDDRSLPQGPSMIDVVLAEVHP
jgi:2-dehydropantoate 2-reductase